MKLKTNTLYLKLAAVMLALSFGVSARAETPREELVHSYRLMKTADHDYSGHRAAAMAEIQTAGKELGLVLEGEGMKEESQWKSDKRMMEARRLLREARKKLEERDRNRVASNIDKAIKEIDIALKEK